MKGGDFHFFPQSAAEATSTSTIGEENVENSKDLLQNEFIDNNANYMLDMISQDHQINFNAPKSVLDDGADLPISGKFLINNIQLSLQYCACMNLCR